MDSATKLSLLPVSQEAEGEAAVLSGVVGLPFELIKLQHEPDGCFPNGVPNPLLAENRQATAEAVTAARADMGIAWDGDADRCFLFDEEGRFIEGYYVVGLLADMLLRRHPGDKVLHDPRLVWNTREVVAGRGGIPVQSRTGHAFIKDRMRLEDAVYGGEMSAHHYFREFNYCDSGMIPWLLVAERLSRDTVPLSALIHGMEQRYPVSGEINFSLDDPESALQAVRETYEPRGAQVDCTDGLGMDMGSWRFNLRPSNTEPLVRLNVESRGDPALMRTKTDELLFLLRQFTSKGEL